MVVARWSQRLAVELYHAGLSFPDRTDPSDACKAQGCFRSEQEFVILTAVQRLFERRAFGDRNDVKLRGHTRGYAETMQIERKSIAEVHAGRCPADQLPPKRQAGLQRAFELIAR